MWLSIQRSRKESGKLQSRIPQSLASAVLICIKLVMTFQVSLRLKCLLDHFELSWPVPRDPPDIKRQAFKRTEAPCQGSGVTNSLPWALQWVMFSFLVQHKGKGEGGWGAEGDNYHSGVFFFPQAHVMLHVTVLMCLQPGRHIMLLSALFISKIHLQKALLLCHTMNVLWWQLRQSFWHEDPQAALVKPVISLSSFFYIYYYWETTNYPPMCTGHCFFSFLFSHSLLLTRSCSSLALFSLSLLSLSTLGKRNAAAQKRDKARPSRWWTIWMKSLRDEHKSWRSAVDVGRDSWRMLRSKDE